MLFEVELLSYIDHKAADDYDAFTEVSVKYAKSVNQPMAYSVSRQGEPNPALWLATQEDYMALSYMLGVTFPQIWFSLFHMINPLLTKLFETFEKQASAGLCLGP